MIFESFFKKLQKRKAISSYVHELPRLLVKDYGPSQTYTPAQVKRSIERAGLSTDYTCYALSMFSDQPSFAQYHYARGENCDYAAMRAEVAASHFHGNTHFTIIDMPTGDLRGDFGSGAGESHAGSGHHGGHDGHGGE
jgi:hypothetical protein